MSEKVCEQCGCKCPEWEFAGATSGRNIIICERCLPANHPVRNFKSFRKEGRQ